MFGRSLLAIAASLMTLSAFSATIAVMNASSSALQVA